MEVCNICVSYEVLAVVIYTTFLYLKLVWISPCSGWKWSFSWLHL